MAALADMRMIGPQNDATVVHAAARRFAHSAVERFATGYGIDVNAKDSSGATALHLACAPAGCGLSSELQKSTVMTLLRLGADPLAKDEARN